jgi:DNA-binding NtrC family response regulator
MQNVARRKRGGRMQTVLFKKNAILLEQDSLQRRLYGDILNANGFEVYFARSVMDGLIKIKEDGYDLAVIDTESADESFMEKFVKKVQCEQASKFMPVIGISIYSEEVKKNIVKMLDAFLTKPFSIDKFIECVFKCIEKKNNAGKDSSSQ